MREAIDRPVPVTIFDYVKSKVGEKSTYEVNDFYSNGVAMLGGCSICEANIAAWNACPSKSGYWKCLDCIGDDGFMTVTEFENWERPRASETQG